MNVEALPFEMKQIQLGNTVFEGQNNAYVIGTEPDAITTMIDTGVALPETRRQLEAGLEDHGLGFEAIDMVLLTHWHGDHVGLAGAIQQDGGATVRAHADDAPLIEQRDGAFEAMAADQRELFDRWGMPNDAREELLAFMDDEGLLEDPPTVTPFTNGARFDIGSVELEAVHLPGHTAGLSGFTVAGSAGTELFSGDALLPYYTPNVGGADTRVERPLEKYLTALATIVDGGYTRAWPGHRGPIINPRGRAADIIVHHRARTRRIVDYLADNHPVDAWTVSAHLFGSLSSIHILHGPGEAYAHLEHLAEADIVDVDDGKGPRTYSLDVDPVDLDTLFPSVPDSAKDIEAIPGPEDT